MLLPIPNKSQNSNMPNRPYTMLGIPDSVSRHILIILTIRLPFRVYLERWIAPSTPIGTDMATVMPIIMSVERSAGITVTSDEREKSNDGVRL